MNNLFNKELLVRILSVSLFVPLILFPIIYNNYLPLIFLLINAIILHELNEMKSQSKYKFLIDIYIFITITTFLLFIFIIITKKITSIEIIEIIFIVWLFDTFSFVGGKLIGGRKIYPKISSGKTYSGLISGITFTSIVMMSYYSMTYSFELKYLLLILFLITISFIGDMFASILKRFSNIKDSGNILPGHGGLFDRFDSFIAVFFVVTIYLAR